MLKTEAPFWWPEPRTIIAMMMIAAMILLAFTLIWRGKDVPDSDMLKMLIGGFMTTGFATIINFYYGSSRDSSSKTDTISKLAENQTVVPPTKP